MTCQPGAVVGADRSEIRRALLAGIMPTKYSYVRAPTGQGRSRHFDYVPGDRQLLREILRVGDGPRSIVDIGPGSGEHVVQVLAGSSSAAVERYLALDFAEGCLAAAADRVGALGLAVHTQEWDLERSPTTSISGWRVDAAPVVAMLCGNTLGNVESVADSLGNVASSLISGDWLLLSVGRWRAQEAPERYLQPYRAPGFREAANSSFSALGVYGRFTFDLALQGATIVGTSTFSEVEAVPAFLADVMTPGRPVRSFLSRRFERDDVAAALDRSGFSLVNEYDGADHLSFAARRI
jgi:hypothetical protein